MRLQLPPFRPNPCPISPCGGGAPPHTTGERPAAPGRPRAWPPSAAPLPPAQSSLSGTCAAGVHHSGPGEREEGIGTGGGGGGEAPYTRIEQGTGGPGGPAGRPERLVCGGPVGGGRSGPASRPVCLAAGSWADISSAAAAGPAQWGAINRPIPYVQSRSQLGGGGQGNSLSGGRTSGRCVRSGTSPGGTGKS